MSGEYLLLSSLSVWGFRQEGPGHHSVLNKHYPSPSSPPPPGEKGGWGKGRREKEGAPKEEIKNFLFAKVIAYLKKSKVLFDEKLT